MRIILNITWTELKLIFYSPIAWFVLVIFAAQCGFTFTNSFEDILSRQIINSANWDISREIFSKGQHAMLPSVQNYLFLYVPLITMGIINRERYNGTLPLLYSSPITSIQIVLGKYMALMTFGLILMTVLMIPFLFSCFTIESFCIPAVLTAFLGIYLLICTYAAIGLFMSCIISYPVAAGICTMVFFIILKQIGGIWQDIEGVREITYWLGIDGHVDNLFNGLITSEDILYYVLVSALFVSWSIVYISISRQAVSLFKRSAYYIGIAAIIIGIGILTTQPKLKYYYDTSYENANSLKPEHREIMKHLTGKLTITTYSNLFDERSLTPQDVLFEQKLLEPYIRFKPDIHLKYVWYYDDGKNHPDEERFRKEALRLAMVKDVDFNKYISPKEIRKMIDLSSENYQYVQILEYNGKSTRLRHYNDIAVKPMEGDYITAFKRLGMKLPIMGFLTGHGERRIDGEQNRDYTYIAAGKRNRNSFQNIGFDVKNIVLSINNTVLDSCDILIIADPRKTFESWELKQLEAFIDKGGDLIITAEQESHKILSPLLNYLGVQLNDGYLLQQHKEELPNLIFVTPDSASVRLNENFKWILDGQMALNGASALKWNAIKDFVYTPVFCTLPDTWLSEKIPYLNSNGTYHLSGTQGRYITGLGISRTVNKSKQHILIMGDADWLSNGELNSKRSSVYTSYLEQMKALVGWFSYGELPIDTSRRIPPDRILYFNSDGIPLLHAFFGGIVPAILLLTGFILIVKRRKR